MFIRRRRVAITKKALIDRMHACMDATLSTTPTPGRPPQGTDAMTNVDSEIAYPPGRYFIGDLCYALSDEAFQSLPDLPSSSAHPRIVMVQDQPVWIGWAALGDGRYQDNEGCPYAIASGLIGVIPLAVCDVHTLEETMRWGPLGRIVEYATPFTPTCIKGVFRLGHLMIDTRGADADDDA